MDQEQEVEINRESPTNSVHDSVLDEEMMLDESPVLNQSLKNELVENFNYIKQQNKTILEQHEKMCAWLAKIDSRIGHIEQILESRETLDENYSFETIENSDKFYSFLSQIDNDKKFRRQTVLYLYKKCPNEGSKYYHYGVVKSILNHIFDVTFLKICRYKQEKGKKNKPQKDSDVPRILLGENTRFKKLLQDVLNRGQKKGYDVKNVEKAISEYFKWFVRTTAN